MPFSRGAVIATAKVFGPQLKVPARTPPFDPVCLMLAFASNESSMGQFTTPRYERAYDVGGIYSGGTQAPLLAKYGRAAAYSYGCWQIMPCNALGFSPEELNTDITAQGQAFVNFFNDYIIARHEAMTLDQFAMVYNAGSILTKPGPGVINYINDLKTNYNLMLANKSNNFGIGVPTNAVDETD